jgi:metal-responsive CopG/Arc/MetJ family transcriptional regulator
MNNSLYPRLTIRLSGDLASLLNDTAKARDVSKSKLIRQALRQFLSQSDVQNDLGRLSNNFWRLLFFCAKLHYSNNFCATMSDIEFDREKSVAFERRVDVKLVKERPSNDEGFASANSGRDVE